MRHLIFKENNGTYFLGKEELVNKLREIKAQEELKLPIGHPDYTSAEDWHGEADELLLKYINDKDISEAYEEIEKWYS